MTRVFEWAAGLYAFRPFRVFSLVLAGLYAMGAAAHVQNILGTGERPVWSETPLAWRAGDLVFLFLDAAIVVGLILARGWAVLAFLAAAIAQIAMYTLFRGVFAAGAADSEAIAGLLGTHLATLILFTALAIWARRAER